MSLTNLFSKLKGGAGSGHHDHAGIPGHRGGSSSSGLGSVDSSQLVEVPTLYHGSDEAGKGMGIQTRNENSLGRYFFDDENSAKGYGKSRYKVEVSSKALDLTTSYGQKFYNDLQNKLSEKVEQRKVDLDSDFASGKITKREFLDGVMNANPPTKADLREALVKAGVDVIKEIPHVYVVLNSSKVSKSEEIR